MTLCFKRNLLVRPSMADVISILFAVVDDISMRQSLELLLKNGGWQHLRALAALDSGLDAARPRASLGNSGNALQKASRAAVTRQ